MAKRTKGTTERRLFDELSAGIDAMRDHREGRLQPRTHVVQPQQPAAHAAATTAWVAPPMVYTLKVTLMETDPPIWRRLRVSGQTTLARLDRIIQTAMGWTNSHLHTFTAGGVVCGAPNAETEVRNERRARLGGIASEPGEAFRLRGDSPDSPVLLHAREHAAPGLRAAHATRRDCACGTNPPA